MVRHRRSRAGPSALQIEMMTMPQSGLFGYYFPYNSDVGGYDSSNYIAEYSDGQITKQDVDTLLNELNQHPEVAPATCDPLLFLLPVITIGMIVGFLVFIFSTVGSRTRDCTGTNCRSTGPSVGGIIGTIMGINLGGIFLIFFLVCCVAKRARERLARRNRALTEIINRHQQSTFVNKNVIVRMSNQGGYVAIEFKWRVNNAPMQYPGMNQMTFPNMNVPNGMPPYNQFGHQAFMPPQPNENWNRSNAYKPPMTTITSAPVF